jgi:hypothetical protein
MPDSMGFVELGFGAVSMPRRRIGQEVLGFGAEAVRRSCLEELRALIEWSIIERLLDPIHCAAKGGPPKVVQTGAWGSRGDDTLRALRSWNYSVQRVRCRIEKRAGSGNMDRAISGVSA